MWAWFLIIFIEEKLWIYWILCGRWEACLNECWTNDGIAPQKSLNSRLHRNWKLARNDRFSCVCIPFGKGGHKSFHSIFWIRTLLPWPILIQWIYQWINDNVFNQSVWLIRRMSSIQIHRISFHWFVYARVSVIYQEYTLTSKSSHFSECFWKCE